MLETEANILVHVVIAEAVREGFAEYWVRADDGITVGVVDVFYRIVVGEFVGIVPTILEAIGKREEITFGGIANGFCPTQTRRQIVAPSMVVAVLVVDIERIHTEEAVPRVSIAIFLHVAEFIVNK